jgi:hypothetical protein
VTAMPRDEMWDAARRYQASLPLTSFPRLDEAARTDDPRQWAAMMHAAARLWQLPAQPGAVIAFEAQTFITTLQLACRHRWVTVTERRGRTYRECPYCDKRTR